MDDLGQAVSNLTQTMQNALFDNGNSPASDSFNQKAVANLDLIPSIASRE